MYKSEKILQENLTTSQQLETQKNGS